MTADTTKKAPAGSRTGACCLPQWALRDQSFLALPIIHGTAVASLKGVWFPKLHEKYRHVNSRERALPCPVSKGCFTSIVPDRLPFRRPDHVAARSPVYPACLHCC